MNQRRIQKLWLGLFALWVLMLSGVFNSWTGTPGVIQALRLRSLLHGKEVQRDEIQTNIERLDAEAGRLERSPVAQEREIRRTLGYASADELIFDFTLIHRPPPALPRLALHLSDRSGRF